MQKIAELSLCGLGGFPYNSLVQVSSLKIINVDAKMMHIFDASYIQKTSKHIKTQQNTAKHSITQHFDAFSNEKRSRTCRNSFSAVSKAMALRFCTYSALDLLCPNICAASTLSAEKLNFRARTFRPPRGRYILE